MYFEDINLDKVKFLDNFVPYAGKYKIILIFISKYFFFFFSNFK
jgi:hypothetical protein